MHSTYAIRVHTAFVVWRTGSKRLASRCFQWISRHHTNQKARGAVAQGQASAPILKRVNNFALPSPLPLSLISPSLPLLLSLSPSLSLSLTWHRQSVGVRVWNIQRQVILCINTGAFQIVENTLARQVTRGSTRCVQSRDFLQQHKLMRTIGMTIRATRGLIVWSREHDVVIHSVSSGRVCALYQQKNKNKKRSSPNAWASIFALENFCNNNFKWESCHCMHSAKLVRSYCNGGGGVSLRIRQWIREFWENTKINELADSWKFSRLMNALNVRKYWN